MVCPHRIMAATAAAFIVAVLLTGCGPSGPANEKVTPENLNKINLEMKLADVEAILGPGEASAPGPSAQPGDKLTWKKWKHSPRGSEIIIGFDSTNTVAVFDKNIVK